MYNSESFVGQICNLPIPRNREGRLKICPTGYAPPIVEEFYAVIDHIEIPPISELFDGIPLPPNRVKASSHALARSIGDS